MQNPSDIERPLTEAEIATILDSMSGLEPTIVGGQAINLWCRFLGVKLDRELTSSDIDFYRNPEAARQLAERLPGILRVANGSDLNAVNSATVVGELNGRSMVIDFVHAVSGVEDKALRERAVTLTGALGPNGQDYDLRLMHPLDCLRSRISNINVLHRESPHSLRQTRATILALDRFIDLQVQLDTKTTRRDFQATLMELGWLIRRTAGSRFHVLLSEHEQAIDILARRLDDVRIDARWRDLTLAPEVERCQVKLDRYERRETFMEVMLVPSAPGF